MSNIMRVDAEQNADTSIPSMKDFSEWRVGFEKSEDDLRNGSFKYNVLEGLNLILFSFVDVNIVK